MKKPFKHQITRLPKILTCQRDFYQIDAFMDMVENDAVNEVQGEIVMLTFDKEWYQVLPALDGWMECFSNLAKAMHVNYDDAPMRKMCARLNAVMPLSLKTVQEVKAVINAQRKLYMLAPHGIINQVANALLHKEAAAA